MSVSDTSIDAYIEHKETGKLGEQTRKILEFFEKYNTKDWSRSEVSKNLDIRLSSVCGRVDELIKFKFLQTDQKRKCEVTGKTVKTLKLIEE